MSDNNLLNVLRLGLALGNLTNQTLEFYQPPPEPRTQIVRQVEDGQMSGYPDCRRDALEIGQEIADRALQAQSQATREEVANAARPGLDAQNPVLEAVKESVKDLGRSIGELDEAKDLGELREEDAQRREKAAREPANDNLPSPANDNALPAPDASRPGVPDPELLAMDDRHTKQLASDDTARTEARAKLVSKTADLPDQGHAMLEKFDAAAAANLDARVAQQTAERARFEPQGPDRDSR